MIRIHVYVSFPYPPRNDHTLEHPTVVTIFTGKCGDVESACRDGEFTLREILAMLKDAGFSDAQVKKAETELLSRGNATFDSDEISEADLQRIGLL